MSAQLARLSTRFEDGILIAAIGGEIDMSNAHPLADSIRGRLTNEAHGLVLDLDELEYLDSAGIHAIFVLREQLTERGQGIALVVREDSMVADALRLAGVEQAVAIHTALPEAIAGIAAADSD